MTDKFAEYYKSEERQADLSQYVHENFKIILSKMLSEMRRKLDIPPDMENTDGYVSLMVSLHGRMFNEMVYSLAGVCQATKMNASEIIPISSLDILISLLRGVNPLAGEIRNDIRNEPDKFKKLYLECIDELREIREGLPK